VLKAGRQVLRWRARLGLTVGCAAFLGAALFLGVADLYLRFGRLGRVAGWAVLVALAGATAAWVVRVMRRQVTAESIAAGIERAFPELDNHLINYLQFAQKEGDNPFIKAYVHEGVPGWRSVELGRMRNRRLHRGALWTLLGVVVLLLMMSLLTGGASAVATLRVVNPFSARAPVSLTKLLEVRPGSTSVPRGDALELSCLVRGRQGHAVELDIAVADGDTTTYALGEISAGGVETFSYRIARVASDIRYRFRAGDAAFPAWYSVTARPPPAFVDVRLRIRPPAYTGAEVQELDALGSRVEILEGSQVDVLAECNVALKSVTASIGRSDPLLLAAPAGDTGGWSGSMTVTNGRSLQLKAMDEHGDEGGAMIEFTLLPDRAPAIQVLAPAGRTTLAPGKAPAIEFAVVDDYGITNVYLEQVTAGAPPSEDGTLLTSWPAGGPRFSQLWIREAGGERHGDQELVFRVVAQDNCPLRRHRARSAPVVFTAATLETVTREKQVAEKRAVATLGRVVDLQRDNIAKTKAYQGMLDSTRPDHWKDVADRQREIRRLTRQLLENEARPLGSLTSAAKRLYVREMADVIVLLSRVAEADAATQPPLVGEAVSVEEAILRHLTFAEVAAEQTRVERRVDEIAALLAAMIRGQGEVLEQTRGCVTTGKDVGDIVVDRQDGLAEDLTDFANACRRESLAVGASDQVYAGLLRSASAQCEELKIRDSMLLAAEQLDENQPARAVPHEESALQNLKSLQDLFERIEAAKDQTREAEMAEALAEAKETVEKIKELHESALQSMDMVMAQRDAGASEMETLEEEYSELVSNTKEAILEIPRDLHIFKELNVANELVEEVITDFREVEQAPGSETWSPEDTKDLAFNKEDIAEVIEALENLGERLEDLEMFMGNKADDERHTFEPLDLEEMAEIDPVELAEKVEDIVGELLEEDEDAARTADDGAINLAVRDFEAGGEIKEGQIASFAAKGKTGNKRPDHKEQDGRANVGRQGMSAGETAAAEGEIREGDDNIEARRTQDPTQDGKVDAKGEADAQATGGGKQGSGAADRLGMAGGTRRMDADRTGASRGLEAIAKQADSMYAKASLKNVHADSLRTAAHHLRQAADAIADGRIEQVREFRRQAVTALRKARTELSSEVSDELSAPGTYSLVEDVVEAGPDEAPEGYRELVAEYYKALNEEI